MNPADIAIGVLVASAVILLCIRAYRKHKRGETG